MVSNDFMLLVNREIAGIEDKLTWTLVPWKANALTPDRMIVDSVGIERVCLGAPIVPLCREIMFSTWGLSRRRCMF